MEIKELTNDELSSKRNPKLAKRILAWLLLSLLSLTIICPFIWVFSLSLKTNFEFYQSSPWALPKAFNTSNYLVIFHNSSFFQFLMNSTVVSVMSVTAVVVFGSMSGYIIARFRQPVINFLAIVVLGALMIPAHMILMPLFVFSHKLGILNTLWAVIGPSIAFGLPFSMFIFRGFFVTVPGSLIEAAKIDGASEFKAFYAVMLPMAKPAAATVLIFQFLASWNDFLFPLVLLQDPAKYTLPLGLTSLQGVYQSNYPAYAAGLFLASLPGLILYICFNKAVIEGMVQGAVKG